MLSHRSNDKILLEDNLQQNFALIKDAVIEMRFVLKFSIVLQ